VCLLIRFANMKFHADRFPFRDTATPTEEYDQHVRNQIISKHASWVGGLAGGIATFPLLGMFAMKYAFGAGQGLAAADLTESNAGEAAEASANATSFSDIMEAGSDKEGIAGFFEGVGEKLGAVGDFIGGKAAQAWEAGGNATEAIEVANEAGLDMLKTSGFAMTMLTGLGVSMGKMAAQHMYQKGLFGLEKKFGLWTPTTVLHQKREKERSRFELNEQELGDITRPNRFDWKNELQALPTPEEYDTMLSTASAEQKKKLNDLVFVNFDYGDEQKTMMQNMHSTLFSFAANSAALEPYERTLSKIRKDLSQEIVRKLVRDTGYRLPGNRKK